MTIDQLNMLGIIHLSDLHISNDKRSQIADKFKSCYEALKNDFENCGYIFIIVSGDVANTGNINEYEIALESFLKLSKNLKNRYSKTKIQFIIVPGNHDCDFTIDSQIRKNIIENINYERLGDDGSIFETSLMLQKEFWKFYDNINKNISVPENKIYFKVIEEINSKKVCFHCFNTAWMSQLKEKPGSLFFPVKRFDELRKINEYDLSVAIFHHPVNWMNPNTKENNKIEFQNTLEKISSLQLIGHEHIKEVRKTERIDISDSKTLCANGVIFHSSENKQISGFQTFTIDLHTLNCSFKNYKWDEGIYFKEHDRKIKITRKTKRRINLKNDFKLKLERLNIPISFKEKEPTLSDLFIYPDLEYINFNEKDNIEDYFDSSNFIDLIIKNKLKHDISVLEGDSQIGKTSLIYKLLLQIYSNNFYPILLDGSEIVNDNIDSLIKPAFNEQYCEEEKNYDYFHQLPKNQKIIFIDNFHNCKLPNEKLNEFIEKLRGFFGVTFLTIESVHSIISEYQSPVNGIEYYSIKPLGYLKRDSLIYNYLIYLYPNSDKKILHIKRKNIFDKLRIVLGDKLIPAYPLFIITIIQALDYRPINNSKTSYGNCYQTLIHIALDKAGVHTDYIDTYINFITEFAYYMFKLGSDSIAESDLYRFYQDYSEKFFMLSFENIKKTLLKSVYGKRKL